jgi:hypothetical protein
MPGGMSGVALARAAQRLRPLKAILTSGAIERPDTGEAAAEFPIVAKPYQRGELVRAIRAALDAGPADR